MRVSGSREDWRRRLVRLLLLGGVLPLLATGADAAALDDTAEKYRPGMIDCIDQAYAGARTLKERVAAGDLAGAKRAWIDARIGWEKAEVFTAGFVADLDAKIDAWPNAQSGFHAIEAKLFGASSLDLGDETELLVYYLADLDVKIHNVRLNAQGLFNGTARLAYEIGENKADGGESRYSGTSLDDMRHNIDGIDGAYRLLFADALSQADPALAKEAQAKIDALHTLLAAPNLAKVDGIKVRAVSEELVLAMQQAAPELDLRAPTLEDLVE